MLLLYPVWQGDLSAPRRLYLSVFHSVSSFCNAGFSLFSGNFAAYTGSALLNLTVTGLVIFGGLGFIVQRELITKAWAAMKPRRWRTRSSFLKNLSVGEPPLFLSLQTKIVVATTAALLAGGVLLFAVLEWKGALAGMSLKEKVLAAWFQSVTPRTAGFNTVDLGALAPATWFLMIVLMFIGASPGGTGGGVKTSTFALLVGNMTSALRQRRSVEIMKRTVPGELSRQALMVVLLATALIVSGVFVLSVTERGVPFLKLLFEEVSAFGTVGLSTGFAGSQLSLSASLSTVGKLVIIFTMFAGRIGPLTLVIAIAERRYAVAYEYPTERVIIG